MIKTLANIPEVDQEDVLVRAIDRLLPSPVEVNSTGGETDHADPSQRVLMEVRDRLHLRKDDQSPKAVSRMYNALTEEILSYNLSAGKEKLARVRLGQRGELRPDQYIVRFTDQFSGTTSKLGVRRSHVEEVLKAPDEVEHFLPVSQVDVAQPRFASLYVKRITPPSGTPFTWLIESQRIGDSQTPGFAWRIYQSDFPSLEYNCPHELLQLFLGLYGLEFQIVDGESTRLVYRERFPDPPGFNFEIRDNAVDKSSRQIAVSSTVNKVEGAVEVSITYIVNLALYCRDLNRHGVPTSFPTAQHAGAFLSG